MDQCREIAKAKAKDMNWNDIEAGAQQIAGTARSMGLTVEG
jgi:large subunit ribosomal protein L11